MADVWIALEPLALEIMSMLENGMFDVDFASGSDTSSDDTRPQFPELLGDRPGPTDYECTYGIPPGARVDGSTTTPRIDKGKQAAVTAGETEKIAKISNASSPSAARRLHHPQHGQQLRRVVQRGRRGSSRV